MWQQRHQNRLGSTLQRIFPSLSFLHHTSTVVLYELVRKPNPTICVQLRILLYHLTKHGAIVQELQTYLLLPTPFCRSPFLGPSASFARHPVVKKGQHQIHIVCLSEQGQRGATSRDALSRGENTAEPCLGSNPHPRRAHQ